MCAWEVEVCACAVCIYSVNACACVCVCGGGGEGGHLPFPTFSIATPKLPPTQPIQVLSTVTELSG